MSRRSSRLWQDGYSTHYEISIRTEFTRFACMFYLFTLCAFVATIFLCVLASNSYHDESESLQRRFLPYSVLATISLVLCLIFFFGSLVYTRKFLRASPSKQAPVPLPRSIDSSATPRVKEEKSDAFVLNTEESYYASTKPRPEHSFKPPTNSYQACQTDV